MIPSIVARRRSEESGGTPRVNIVAILILLASVAIGLLLSQPGRPPIPLLVMTVVGAILMQSPRIAQQWERALILRLGRFVGLRGPGLFWVVPFVDRVSSWIDQRTITTSFAAERSRPTPCR